jgi:hypothetical protein
MEWACEKFPVAVNLAYAPLTGDITMWEQLTPADIQRAKARAAALRCETLNRHVEELRILDADEAEIGALERLITAFSERYMNPAKEAGSRPAEDVGAPARSDSQQDADPPRLQVPQQVSPNFGGPMRRLLRG